MSAFSRVVRFHLVFQTALRWGYSSRLKNRLVGARDIVQGWKRPLATERFVGRQGGVNLVSFMLTYCLIWRALVKASHQARKQSGFPADWFGCGAEDETLGFLKAIPFIILCASRTTNRCSFVLSFLSRRLFNSEYCIYFAAGVSRLTNERQYLM